MKELIISGRTKKTTVGGRHRGAESADTSTPCIFTWGSTTAVGKIPLSPGNSSTDHHHHHHHQVTRSNRQHSCFQWHTQGDAGRPYGFALEVKK